MSSGGSPLVRIGGSPLVRMDGSLLVGMGGSPLVRMCEFPLWVSSGGRVSLEDGWVSSVGFLWWTGGCLLVDLLW